MCSHYDQFDNAVNVMMDHSTEAWTHENFKDILKNVSNSELYYKAASFYLSGRV